MIYRLAPDSVVEEYLQLFSKTSSPPQIKYFILPAIVRNSENPVVKAPGYDILSVRKWYFL